MGLHFETALIFDHPPIIYFSYELFPYGFVFCTYSIYFFTQLFFCPPICFSNKPALIFLLKFIIYHIKQLFFQTKKIQKQNDNSVW